MEDDEKGCNWRKFLWNLALLISGVVLIIVGKVHPFWLILLLFLVNWD